MEYKSLKQAVLDHLKHRQRFDAKIDPVMIHRLARVWALWLLYEKYASMSTPGGDPRLVKNFHKIHRMLSAALQELALTPPCAVRSQMI